jgi:hypothetical protein
MKHLHLYESFDTLQASPKELETRINTLLTQGMGIKLPEAPPLKVEIITSKEYPAGTPFHLVNVYVQEQGTWEYSGHINYYFTDGTIEKGADYPYESKPHLEGTRIGAEISKAFEEVYKEDQATLVSSKAHTERGRVKYLAALLNKRLLPQQVANKNEFDYRSWQELLQVISKGLTLPVSYEQTEEILRDTPDLMPSNIQFKIV